MQVSYTINLTPSPFANIGRVTGEMIDAFEDHIRSNGLEIELEHVDHFSKGVYARELHIPAGTRLSGKIHKYQNLNILSKGDISVLMEDGTLKRIQAPFTIVSPPGTRRIAYAHTDVIWTTIHGTDETDVDKIEEQFIAQTPGDYQLFCEQVLRLGV